MSQRLRNAAYRNPLGGDARSRQQRTTRCNMRGDSAEILADARFQFDPDAWDALLAEQRLLIASAAGVDPSKVRIHFGH
jgi:hypothetical protein